MTREAEILAVAKDIIKPVYTGDAVKWAEDNILDVPDSPIRGKLNLSRTPHIAAALRILTDPETKLAVITASTQSGKSLLQRIYSCWQIVNAPAAFMMLQPNDPEAKDWFMRYVRPLFMQCPPVRALLSDSDNDKSTIADFKNGVTLYCRGAWNENNLQRLSLRTVICDEAWLYPRGHILEASARTQSFSWMGRVIVMGQAGCVGDEFTTLMEGTDKREWNFSCPVCSKLQAWKWEYVRFPEDAKLAGGSWDYKKVENGTTYECKHCNTRLPDTSGTRAEANKIERGAKFIPTANASSWGSVGLHWNCLCNSSWGKEAVKLLKAKESFDLYNDTEGRRVFKQKRLALAWSEDGGEMVAKAEAGDYSLGDSWDKEAWITPEANVVDVSSSTIPAGSIPFRTLAVDVQRGHFYAEVRSWAKTGHSRLLSFGKLETWQSIDDLCKQWNINRAMVGVDSGDQTQEVYAQCAARGWKALRGSGQVDFTVQDNVNKTAKRFYSDKQLIFVPSSKNRAEMIVWSNLSTKDLLAGLQLRKMHTYPRDIGDEYVLQLTAEIRIKDSRSGKPMWIMPSGRAYGNHAWDCACMGLILAVRWGIIGREATADNTRSNPSTDTTSA